MRGLMLLLVLGGLCWASEVQPFQVAGPGKAAHSGTVPVLSGLGTASPGSPNELSLSDLPPGVAPLLVVGMSEYGGPFGGGILGPSPDVLVRLPPADGEGQLEHRFRMPPSAPVGLVVWMQAWMRAGQEHVGFAATNTLRVDVRSSPGPIGVLLPSITYPTPRFTESLAVEDLDLDGLVDLVAVSRQPTLFGEFFTDLVVMRGLPSGDFELVQALELPGEGWAGACAANLFGDARPEVICLSRFSGDLAVLTADADGQLGLHDAFAVGSKPFDVEALDADGDGLQDLVVALLEDQSLVLWHGDGKGGFTVGSSLMCTIPPRALLVRDLNGDGLQDIGVAGQATGFGGDGVNLFFGGRDGFGAAVGVHAGGKGAGGLAASDLDADGDLDLAVANRETDKIAVLLNDGAGGYSLDTLLPAGDGPYDVALCDLDGDELPDLVANNAFGSTLSMYWGLGDGSFAAAGSPVQVVENSRDIAIADVDGDGDQDLFVAGSPEPGGVGGVSVVRNLRARKFATTLAMPAEGAARGVTLGDVNGDGALDVAFLRWVDAVVGLIEVRIGLGDGTFALDGPAYPIGPWPEDVALGDLDGDGLLDLVAVSPEESTLSVLHGTADGSFLPRVIYESAGSPFGFVLMDANSDGLPDVAVTGRESNDVAVFLNDGEGGLSLSSRISVGQSPLGIACGDFNGDGYDDAVTANYESNTVSVMLGSGRGLEFGFELPGGLGPVSVSVGDVNADGDADLAIANAGGDGVAFYLGDGAGGFLGSPVFLPTPNVTEAIELADLDHDGRDEVLFCSWTVVVRQGGGELLMGPQRFLPAGDTAWQGIAVGDVDADGDQDVVAIAALENTLAVMLNDLYCPPTE